MKSTQLLTLKSVLGSAVSSKQSRIFSAGDPALENPSKDFLLRVYVSHRSLFSALVTFILAHLFVSYWSLCVIHLLHTAFQSV